MGESMDGKNLGRMGEDIASDYVRGLGWHITAENYRCRIGEIDLIAVKDDILIFIEVKTRRCLAFGIPAESVNKTKIQHIKRTASYYLTEKMRIRREFADYRFRFDVIEINFVNDCHRLSHIEDAF